MLIDCILTACNLNPLYLDFIPIFIKAWTKLYPSIDIKIILIHSEIPLRLKLYAKHIICFPSIGNISTGFISQYIRLLYPAVLNYKNGVIITDIDMIPMNSIYYTKIIEPIHNNAFISYRNPIISGTLLSNHRQIAVCYCVASPSTWKEIFNVTSHNDITIRLKEAYARVNYNNKHGGTGWSTDQLNLYRKITNWHARTRRFVCLTDRQTQHRRLDRISRPLSRGKLSHILLNRVKMGYYSDYHMCRPYTQFKQINDIIVDFLPTNTI